MAAAALKKYNAPGVFNAGQLYNTNVEVPAGSELLFSAGQVGSGSGAVDETQGRTAVEQADRCYKNVWKLLEASGMGW